MDSASQNGRIISALHASIIGRAWRHLPRAFRQDVFARVTELGLRPRTGKSPDPKQSVTVVGAVRAPTGLGQAARLALSALQHAGIDCRCIDLTEALLQPATEPLPSFPQPTGGPGTLLFYVTPPNAALALRSVPYRIRKNKCLVAGWVCETTSLPEQWTRQAALFNCLTAPTRFAARAIAQATGRSVRVIGHPVEAETPRFAPAPWPSSGSRRVVGAMLDIGSSPARKNIEGLTVALEHILLHSRPDVEVRLKIRDPGGQRSSASIERLSNVAPGRVFAWTTNETRTESLAFLDSLDLLLSMSRAEGFGLPYVEAILRGIPVAAARWGGAEEFLNDSNSVALPFSLVPIVDPSGAYSKAMGSWAEVDPIEAAHLVLATLRKRERTQARAIDIPQIASHKQFIDGLFGSEPESEGSYGFI